LALIGHHFVDNGLARLAGLLHVAPRQRHELALRAALPLLPDPLALSRATAIYAGHHTLTTDEFIDLAWLSCFARSGRQLLMCHALRLLEGWHHMRRRSGSIAAEAAILGELVFSAGQCVNLLPPGQILPLSLALKLQINRLLGLKTSDPTQLRIKAMALLAAADVLQNGTTLQSDAMQLFELAMPNLIASDGGPLHDHLTDYVAWLHPLLSMRDAPLAPKARNALDRARPFLSMLLGSDGRYCFDSKLIPFASLHATAPLQLAPVSCVAHLAAGKCVAIATPDQLHGGTALHIFGNGHHILDAGLFLYGAGDDQSVQALECDGNSDGQWLHQVTHNQVRTAFLSSKGDDLRIEDRLQSHLTPGWLRLDIAEKAKVSVARNGTQATIAIDSRNLWQLTLRGAELRAPTHGNQWLAKATGLRINWALKRINRTATRPGKADVPELPFELEIARQPR
jgi:hypothetical protein